MPSTSPVESVRRAMAILEVLGSAPSLGVKQVAEQTMLTPSTTHRLLTTLVETGFVRQESRTGRYHLTGRLVELAARVPDPFKDLREAARISLDALRRETGETANLVVLDGRDVVYVDQAEGSRSLRMFTHPGQHALAHTTGSGKAMLACHDPADLETLLPATLEQITTKTITTRDQLLSDLRRTRKRGFAIDHEEHEDGVSCIAAAVPGQQAPYAAVSISGPTSRLISANTTQLGTRVRTAAEAVSAHLARPTIRILG